MVLVRRTNRGKSLVLKYCIMLLSLGVVIATLFIANSGMLDLATTITDTNTNSLRGDTNTNSLRGDTNTNSLREEVDCPGGGPVLFERCFCMPGWEAGRDGICHENSEPLPPCGSYDDHCFFQKEYGVAQVSLRRWESAQAHQAAWAHQGTSLDGNDEHVKNFAGYATLSLIKNKSVLGNVLEVGSGPFTQSLTIFEATGLRPKSVTLLEPLAHTYRKTARGCRYKDGVLSNGKGLDIRETTILPIPAEELNEDGSKTQLYDTIILVNVIEHVKDAFIVYDQAFEVLKPGGLVIFHERFWLDYDGSETKNQEEFDLHPIRLSRNFGHWLSTEFDLLYEKEHPEPWGKLGYSWIGQKRMGPTMPSLLGLGESLEDHARLLNDTDFDEHSIWGNGYTGNALEQHREYLSYAQNPWVKTICEVGFTGGHSTRVYQVANLGAKIYRFNDFHKEQLTSMASDFQKQIGNVALTRGDSTTTILTFMKDNPDIYCDIISVDGAKHSHFPHTYLANFKYMANDPNVVLMDDFHHKDWSDAVEGVNEGIKEESMELRRVAATKNIFGEKQKQWGIGEYTMVTLVVATKDLARLESLQPMIDVGVSHPLIQQVIVLWNSEEPVPAKIQGLTRAPGSGKARVRVIHTKSISLNRRFDPNLPIHTGAVMVLDDDLKITTETITCAFKAWRTDPSKLYSFGEFRYVSKAGYSFKVPSRSKPNFVLPRMIFHKSFLEVYHEGAHAKLRKYVDTQAGHCDDVLFASLITKYTGKPIVRVNAYVEDHPRAFDKGSLGMTTNRVALRNECAKHIVKTLGWEMPAIESFMC